MKKTYRVKPGRQFGTVNVYSAGDLVELTEQEAFGFLDILQPAESDIDEVADDDSFDSTPITSLNLNGRIEAALLAAGFDVAGELNDASDEQLLAIEGIGAAALSTIRKAIG